MGAIVKAEFKLWLGFTDSDEGVGLMMIADLTGKAAGNNFGLVVAALLLLAFVHGHRDDDQFRKLLMELGVNPGFGHFCA